MTIAELMTSYEENYKQDIGDVEAATFIGWCNFINRFFYNYLSKIDPERLISTQDYSVSSNPQSSALPSSFKNLQPFGTGLYKLDSSGNLTDEKLIITGPGSSERGFYITGASIVFTGISSENFRMRYLPKLTTLTDTDDSLVIPDEYEHYMIQAIDVIYPQWDEDFGMESLADARFVRALSEVASNIKRTPAVYSTYNAFSAY